MSLDFTITLAGNFQGALEKGNKTLGETSRRAHEAEQAFEAFDYEMGKVRTGALSLNFNAFKEGGRFLMFDMAEAALIAYEAIEKLVDGVADLGKEILKAAGNAEDLNLAVKLDVGVEGADAVEQLTQSFKGTSRFDDDAIKKSLLPLLEQNGALAGTQLLDDVATAATDLAARRKQGVEGVQAALTAFQRISLKGEVDPRILRELAISEVDFFKDLGGLLGVSSKEAEKLSKEGKVKTQTLLSVALHQIAQREGGALGTATLEAAQTLGASLERLRNLPENVFKRAAGGEGVKEIQKGIDALVTTLDGPLGQKAIQSFDKLLGAIGKFANTHADAVFSKLSSALDTISSIVDGNNESWNHFTQTMGVVVDLLSTALAPFLAVERVMLSIGGALIRVSTVLDGFLLDVLGKLGDLITPLYQGALDLGGAIWRGIRDGLYSGVAAIGGAVEGAGRSAIDLARSVLHIGGPPAGALPAFAEGGIVDRPTIAMVGEAGPEAIVPLGGGGLGFGGVNITIGGITVQTGGHGEGSQAQDIAQAIRVELVKVVDEMRAQLGVA